ncbi:uracil-DNA glycosylase family protein [Acidithiobacillus sp. IBUN Pt1247-S3]|uniref:uracil-DNA glycosylase family protein n=1 Tax=Acidithiobacillus sp. IBUN Pt1247-S3 TaxID=3166642 RepID=UPI0034E50626
MISPIFAAQDQYLQDEAFARLLQERGISILQDFLPYRSIAEQFWQQYIPEPLPQTVILGLNPGRLGAGLTGIPLLDFRSLASLFPDGRLPRNDTEPSANFFHRVVQNVGAEKFYREFYVSNVSAVGYLRDNKNCNYHELPDAAQRIVEERFVAEMAVVAPKRIIALGREVEATVQRLFPDGSVRISHLPHPSWIMTYRLREAQSWVRRYTQMLLQG